MRCGWRLTLIAVFVAVTTVGLAGEAQVQAIPNQTDLTTLANDQFTKVQQLTSEIAGIGAFRADTRNVVMLPAEMAAARGNIETKLRTELSGGLVDVKLSQFTTDGLARLGEELGTRAGSHIPLQYGFLMSYDAATDKYLIETDAPASVLVPLMAAHPGQLTTKWAKSEAEGRFDDQAPFYGAASVSDGNATCTAGVAVQDNSGKRYMTTAGHCFQLNESISISGDNNYVGTVTYRNTNRDTELLYTNPYPLGSYYNGFIWTGGYKTSPASMPVAGSQYPYYGQSNIYTSGQTTFNQGGRQIKQLNINYCPAGQQTCVSDNTGFTYCCGTFTQPGDSGAPIYVINGSRKAIIIGLHVGKTYDSAGQVVMVGVTMGSVLHAYSLSMVTQ